MPRFRIGFVAGLAAGFVLGARAGRERYEQIKKLARRAAESPAVQQAAGALQAQAAGVLKAGTHKVTREVHDRVPWLVKSAKHKVGDRIPGRRGDGGAATYGADRGQEAAEQRPFAATSEPSNGRRSR
jgi:hypothetical protein